MIWLELQPALTATGLTQLDVIQLNCSNRMAHAGRAAAEHPTLTLFDFGSCGIRHTLLLQQGVHLSALIWIFIVQGTQIIFVICYLGQPALDNLHREHKVPSFPAWHGCMG